MKKKNIVMNVDYFDELGLHGEPMGPKQVDAPLRIAVRCKDNTVNVLSDGICVLTVNPALSGDAGAVTVLASKDASGNVRVEMCIRPQGSMHLSRAALRFEYLPGDTTERWTACRESFHWLPNIKTSEKQFAGDHVFRSPAAILTSPTAPGVAVIPDLDTLAACRPAPQYLDMGFPDGESPWIELGFASQKPVGHVYYEPTGEPFEVPSKGIRIAAWIIIAPREAFPGAATSFLWSQFGSRHASDRRPQVMPFWQYADYGYVPALEHLWQEGPQPGTGGITLSTFRKKEGGFRGRSFADDLFFHSRFNNARTAWGLGEWGKTLGHPDWVEKSKEIMNLALSAPREHGLFPAVFAPHDHGWEAKKREPYHIPDAAWTAIWIRKYHAEIAPLPEAPAFLNGLADFLLSAQSPDGGFPTWVEHVTLTHDPRLKGAACGAMATWFMGEEALCPDLPADRKRAYVKAVMRSARHLREYVLPRLRFEDFELYYSCSGKSLDFYDKWTHSYGVNTLAIQWCVEAFRVAHCWMKAKRKK